MGTKNFRPTLADDIAAPASGCNVQSPRLNLGPLPATKCVSRDDWIKACATFCAKFDTLCKYRAINWSNTVYVRNEHTTPVGCCIIARKDRDSWFAGASYCDRRDRHRFTKMEARARALANMCLVSAIPDFSQPVDQIAYLDIYPPSCRSLLKGMLLCRPGHTSLANELVAGQALTIYAINEERMLLSDKDGKQYEVPLVAGVPAK